MEYVGRLSTPGSVVKYEPITIRLPSGCSYTPDVAVFHPDGILELWEVKGAFIHNQRSILAFKEALAAFPMFTWGFAQLTKSGWAIEKVIALSRR